MNNGLRMVVLDDDPTGIQTVHGCLLITQWDEESVRKGFEDEVPFFYILTNTRAMTRQEAAEVIRSAMDMVLKVNRDYDYRLIVVSRSDSCLRGHFPLETDVIRQAFVSHGLPVAEKTPFCPAFIEAGRVTIDGTHYMKDEGRLIPISETEFARDNVFGFHSSVLRTTSARRGPTPTTMSSSTHRATTSWNGLPGACPRRTSSSGRRRHCPRPSAISPTFRCSTRPSSRQRRHGSRHFTSSARTSGRRPNSWNAC